MIGLSSGIGKGVHKTVEQGQGDFRHIRFVTFSPSELTELTADGGWVDVGWLRVFVAAYDGYLFGSGWSRDE